MATSQFDHAPHRAASAGTSARSFLSRNLGLIATVSLLVSGWMLFYTFTMFHPKYAAKATVIIKDSAITNRYVEPEQFYAMQTTSSTSSNPVLNTMGILKSEAISDAMWSYFSEKRPEALKKLKIKTKKDWDAYYQDGSPFIKAKNQPGTDLISIQFSWTDAQIAQEGLNVIVKSFQDASRDLNKEEQISRTKFLSRQMGDIESKLKAIRDQKSEYQSQNETVSVKRESDDLAGSRMELSNKLAQIQAQAKGKEDMVDQYKRLLGMSPETAIRGAAIGQNSTMTKLQDELYRLQQLHSLMTSSLTDNNPKVREVQSQIEQVKANINQERSRVMRSSSSQNDNDEIVADSTRGTMIGEMVKAQGEAQDLRAQAAVMEKRLDQVNTDIRSFPSTAEGLANLEQQETTLSEALDHLRQKVMEGKMKEAQTLSNVFVVDSPRLPEHPSFPNRTHLIVISILMGLASGISVAFIKEQVGGKSVFNVNDTNYPGQIYYGHPGNYTEENFQSQWEETNEANDQPQQEWRPAAATNFVVPNQHPQEAQEAATTPATEIQSASQVPVSAVKNAPNTSDVLGVNLPIEKVEMPVTGSLFDSLLPLAGPMARTVTAQSIQAQPSVQTQNQTHAQLRRDLTQPLSIENQAEIPSLVRATRPVETVVYHDEQLLPPDSVSQPVPQPAITLAEPIETVAAYSEESHVPTMHAAPSATPAYWQDPLSVPGSSDHDHQSSFSDAEEIDEFPSLVVNQEPEATQIAPSIDPSRLTDDSNASTVYEAQAKTMPLPRRRVRSVPKFLLDSNTVDVQTEADEFPSYELVSRKQNYNPEPEIQRPQSIRTADARERSEQEALFEDFSPVPTASSLTDSSDFPPMPTFVPPEFARRRQKNLFGGLFTSAKKARQPELVLGQFHSPNQR